MPFLFPKTRLSSSPRALAYAQQLCFASQHIPAKPRVPPTPLTTSSPTRDANLSSSPSPKYTSRRTWKPNPAVPRGVLPPIGSAVTFVAESALPSPTYHVERSKSRNLPVYTEYKRGGNLHQTTIRKITGNCAALRDELRDFLKKKKEDVSINTLTGHIVIKGHHPELVAEFLRARGM